MSAFVDQVRALRERVGLCSEAAPRPAIVEVRGEGAFDVVDAICPRDLFVRSGQVLHTLLLRKDASVWADLAIAAKRGDYVLLADGIEASDLLAHLRAHTPEGAQVEFVDRSGESLVRIDGPWSWELMGQLVGPEVVGAPYLSFFPAAQWDATCFRTGTTGEYGYEILAPASRGEELRARVRELGERFDLLEVEEPARALCRLENGFFDPRWPVSGLSPIELQLQWRVARDRRGPGMDALRARADAGVHERLTWAITRPDAAQPRVGSPVAHADGTLGRVLHAAHSPLLESWVVLTLLDTGWAHPGIEGLYCDAEGGTREELRSVSPPLLHNLSLAVDVQRHSYTTREEHDLPPVVPK